MVNTLVKYGLEIPCVLLQITIFRAPCLNIVNASFLWSEKQPGWQKISVQVLYGCLQHGRECLSMKDCGTYEFVRDNTGYFSFTKQYPFVTRLDRWKFVKESLSEAARMGEEYGVVMVLQNHAPLIRHWKDTYDLVKEVNSPWLKICLDLPIFEKMDKEYIANAVRTVGSLQVHSHYGGEYYRDRSGAVKQKVIETRFDQPLPDYAHYIGLMRETGYNGYFTFELCHPVLNDAHTPAGIDIVDEH
jgi:sugar phosphate isomerase/epimerase